MAPPRVEESQQLARALGLPVLAAQCLLNRGVEDEQSATEYLHAGLSSLHRPEDLPDMAQAVERIRRALRDDETVCVWGDYDVDGVSGTAVLTRFLRMLGATVIPFIPERTGYPLNT